jgi:hypothetical protein
LNLIKGVDYAQLSLTNCDWSSCTKHRKWAFIYMYVMDIDLSLLTIFRYGVGTVLRYSWYSFDYTNDRIPIFWISYTARYTLVKPHSPTPCFIEMHVPSRDSDRACACVYGVAMFIVTTLFDDLIYFGTVPTVWHILFFTLDFISSTLYVMVLLKYKNEFMLYFSYCMFCNCHFVNIHFS